MRRRAILSLAVLLVLLASAGPARGSGEGGPSPSYRLLRRDAIIGADVWGKRPRMLAAGLGFTGIIGVPGMSTADLAGSESLVRAAGGTWNEVTCAAPTTPELFAYTSASTPQQVEAAYGYPTTYADGLPVEFSWPIRPSTLDASDFRVVLNYIDIVLAGERAAARHITAVEIPASGAYSPFFNPGGPGNDPTPGIHYTAPGPAQVQPIWRALGNPKTVTFRR